MPAPYRDDIHFYPQDHHLQNQLLQDVDYREVELQWTRLLRRERLNANVKRALELRARHAPPGSDPSTLTFHTEGIIYYIGHLHSSSRGYVGQTSLAFMDRFRSHVAQARAMHRHGHNRFAGNELHRHMLHHGLSDLFCLPLQRVEQGPNSTAAFRDIAAPLEDRWAQYMGVMPSHSVQHNQRKRRGYNRYRPWTGSVNRQPASVATLPDHNPPRHPDEPVPPPAIPSVSGRHQGFFPNSPPTSPISPSWSPYTPQDSPIAPPFSPLTPQDSPVPPPWSPVTPSPPPPPPGSPAPQPNQGPPLVPPPPQSPASSTTDTSSTGESDTTSSSASSSQDIPHDNPWQDPRVYGYRDWTRRLRAMNRVRLNGQLHLQDLSHLDPFNPANLHKMLSACLTLNHDDIGITADDQMHLAQLLRAKLFGDPADNPAVDPPRVPFITIFTSPVFDFLSLEQIFAQDELTSLVPALLPKQPLLCFKYEDTLGKYWFNYHATARNFTWDQHQDLINRPCPCATYPHLVPDGHTHIICPLTDLVSDVPALATLTNMGTKYRLPVPDIHVDADLRNSTITALVSACRQYANALSELAGNPHAMSAWLALATTRVTAHVIDALPLGLHITRKGAAHLVHPLPGFTIDDIHHPLMQRIRREFVITHMDKADTNFVAYCRKHYLTTICDDLAPPPPTVNPVFQHIPRDPADILADDAAFLTTMGIPPGPPRLPVYAATAKLHKTPAASRFLTLSHNTSLTPLAKLLNHFFSSFMPHITQLWDKTMRPAGFSSSTLLFTPPGHPESYVISQSSQVIPRIQAYNRSMSSAIRPDAPRHIQTFDFTRLYTNLPHDDLVNKVSALIRESWPAQAQWYKVYPRKSTGHSTFKNTPPPPVTSWYSRDHGERYFVWTLESVCAAIQYLVSHTLLTFGDRVFRQTLGIPMGTNPAVHLATLLLFAYELAHVRRCTRFICDPTLQYFYPRVLTPADLPALLALTTPELFIRRKDIARFILFQFRFTCRYIDDILALGNIIIKDMLFETRLFLGFAGIYPICLGITLASAGTTAPYLDMRLYFLPNGLLTTELYDKRREQRFANIQLVRFPHVSSNLSDRCKYNCISGEFHRLRRIVLQQDNFCRELARVQVQLESRGYSSRRLLRRLHKHCHAYPHLYNCTPRVLLQQIQIYYAIHKHQGLHPYPAPLPLLPEHLV